MRNGEINVTNDIIDNATGAQRVIKEMTNEEQQKLVAHISTAFSPAAPINMKELFAGRIDELGRIFSAISNRGQHGIIFGERGVGKTSLANISQHILTSDNNSLTIMINCNDQDTFETIWEKIFSNITINEQRSAAGFTAQQTHFSVSVSEKLQKPIDINLVYNMLAQLSLGKSIIIIIDEFDRVKNDTDRTAFADTIKWLSDSSNNVTLVLIGVAESVDNLISNHNSIERALTQIRMPRMNVDELSQIIDTTLALEQIKMEIDPKARDLIIYLSQGLPHYTHLLGRESALASIRRKSRLIADSDIIEGIRSAIKDKNESLGRSYRNAINSQRRDALFKEVLLACALAEADELGTFSTADIRTQLNKITNKNYNTPAYSPHLAKFCDDESRGPTLIRKGSNRRFRYSFRNPLLQPYVLMKGIEEKLIDNDLLDNLLAVQPVPAREGLLFG